MRRIVLFFGCLLLLLGAGHSVQAAHVAITMNSVTQTMTLHDEGDNIIPEDGLSSRTYTFNNLSDGTYTIYGYNSASELNGTLTFTVSGADLEMNIFTMTNVSVNNDDESWVYGIDFTIEDYAVHSREGVLFPVTIGENAGHPSILVYEGGSIVLRFVPSAARQAEGYVSANDGRTVNFNETIITTMPMGGTFTSTCPADAEIAMMQKPGGANGSGTIHYVPFTFIAPESVDNDGSTKTYTWRLGNNCQYNMRAWKDGGLTQVLYFYYNTDPTKCPTINFSESDFAARDPKWIDHNPRNLGRMNDCNILLNINEKGYLKLTAGQEYDLLAERDWQIIPNQTENYFLEPDYHYAVYDLNGNPDNSVVEVVEDGYFGSQWRILRAKGTGTAIVTVTYDAASASQYAREKTERKDYYGGRYFGALWPENTGVFVVSVDASANGMDANMRLNEEYNEQSARLAGIYVDAEHDVFYYINDEESFNYTFKPTGVTSVEITYPTIRENDAVYTNGWQWITRNMDDTYTLPLRHGRQIVRLGDGNGNYEYQVLTAKHATRTITNKTNASTTRFLPGANVMVQYDGLYHPANKLSGIYNMSAYITYNGNPTGSQLILGPNQYWFAGTPSAQAVQFTIPLDYTETSYSMTDGVIQVTGFGDPIGNHRTIGKWSGRSPNFTAGTGQTYFGALPDVVIPVTQPSQTRARFITDPEGAEIIKVTNSLSIEVTADGDVRYLLTEGENYVIASHSGCKRTSITVTIEPDCEEESDVQLTLETIPANGWDGTTTTAVTPTNGIYHIKSGYELAWFAAQVNAGTGKSYKAVLDNDIDLCGYNWTPIGNASGKKFGGTFDGQGYSVNNLSIQGERYLGLFGYITYSTTFDVTIKNLTIRGTINSTYDSTTGAQVGGLAANVTGRNNGRINITNVTSYVDITGMSANIAGLIGSGNFLNIDRCANYGNITVTNPNKTQVRDKGVAGIVVLSSLNNTITNSYNRGNVVAGNYVGGIYSGKDYTYNVTVTNCYNTGWLNASKGNSLGASVGAIRNCKNSTDETPNVTNCYANMDFLFNELSTTIVEDEEPWANGEIAYKLGDAFGQQIGVDPLPVLGGMTVYEIELNDGRKIYTNNPLEEYTRNGLTSGIMGTICLPWASEATTGASFYQILYKELDDKGNPFNITLEEVTGLEAGKPYVFIAEEKEIHVYYNPSTEVSNPSDHNGLYGTFDQINDGAAGDPDNKIEGNYVVANSLFQLCGANCTVPEYRAYIKMSEVPLKGAKDAPKPIADRRHIVIKNANPAQTPTAIGQITNDQSPMTNKILINGVLYIQKGGHIYNAQGQMVK